MKLIVKDNIDELINLDEEITGRGINCFQYEPTFGFYKFYIFTCDFDSEDELVKGFSLTNDVIAFDFQRTLLSDIEKWNLYLFCFVNQGVTQEAKSLVEQNKYATRKLVFDNTESYLDIDEKKKVIINKLFNLNIDDKRSKNDKDYKGVRYIIEQADPLLLKAIETSKQIKGKNLKEKEKKSKIVKSYLEMKDNE